MPCALSKSGLQCSGVAAAHSAHCSEVTERSSHTLFFLLGLVGESVMQMVHGCSLQACRGSRGSPAVVEDF